MKIGYFTTHFPYKTYLNKEYAEQYSCGGTENVAYHLAYNIAMEGHETTIFTTSIDFKESVETYNNARIYRYGKTFAIGSAGMSLKLLYKPLEHEIDIVHAHAGNPPAPIVAYWYAKKKKKPFIVTYHGDGQWDWGGVIRRTSVYFYNKYLLDRILSYADVIISPSKYYIGESRVLGKYMDKIVVIPNGINVDEFDFGYSKEKCRSKLGLSIDSRMILFLGTLSPHKGPDILIKAMSEIVKEVPDAKLVFVGDGGMRKELLMLSKKLGIKKNVEFAGFVEEDIKPLYYRAADVFCLPSVMKHEIFGIVNLEAMACSVPIVASKIGGVPDVVRDGENGLLIPPRDSDALADAITYLLENEDIREKIGKNGRKKVEDYSWNRIAEETEKVYSSLTEGEH
ncbi:MAG: glycosyltransferase family 4 protein [Methanosarcinales archaeon]|nr:glycosyltransferase family 4 protein [Methanosarcinales archaeon]